MHPVVVQTITKQRSWEYERRKKIFNANPVAVGETGVDNQVTIIASEILQAYLFRIHSPDCVSYCKVTAYSSMYNHTWYSKGQDGEQYEENQYIKAKYNQDGIQRLSLKRWEGERIESQPPAGLAWPQHETPRHQADPWDCKCQWILVQSACLQSEVC